VGQADLAEMAEIGQVLIGRGEADYAGRRMPGTEALRAAGLEPISLKAKEGLARISATARSFSRTWPSRSTPST
jgi:histidine ammonia-lyase